MCSTIAKRTSPLASNVVTKPANIQNKVTGTKENLEKKNYNAILLYYLRLTKKLNVFNNNNNNCRERKMHP